MIAIIPARGGSKGLPNKNIKLLNGKPLIAYTIEAALQSKVISKIIVSTDDDAIADIAQQYGAIVPFMRPDYLASDTAKSIDVYIYTLDRMAETMECPITEFVVLQPTSPMRRAIDIDNAVNLFKTKKADSVISFCEELHPIVWHKYLTDDGRFEHIFEERINNRQDERKTYFPNGAIYVFKKDLLDQGIYTTEQSYAYLMDRTASVDIDTIEDFEYCEFLMKKRHEKNT